jgi:hypothetical protein
LILFLLRVPPCTLDKKRIKRRCGRVSVDTHPVNSLGGRSKHARVHDEVLTQEVLFLPKKYSRPSVSERAATSFFSYPIGAGACPCRGVGREPHLKFVTRFALYAARVTTR